MKLYALPALIFGIFTLTTCLALADDLVVFTNGKYIRCQIVSYKKGKLTINAGGKQITGLMLSKVSEIRFDVPPPPLAVKGKNKRVSIEKLNAFPEEYTGASLIFSGCEIGQELEKTQLDGIYAIYVISKGGKIILPAISRTGITFVVRKALAKKLSNDIQGGYDWPICALSCTVEKRNEYFLAIVDRIDIYTKGGNLAKSYKE
jgi:hypothetical protein